MSKLDKQVSEFNLVGQVARVFFDGSKPKYLQLITSSGVHLIKLSKECRCQGENLSPGEQVQVTGLKKLDLKKGTVKLKAEQIWAETSLQASTSTSQLPVNHQKTCTGKKAQILVCQKSDCRKKGGNAICAALKTILNEHGLQDQVTIKETGCLKRCKAGPNMVVMPDKARYSRVHPTEVPELINKHFQRI